MSIEYEDFHIFQEIAQQLNQKHYLLSRNEVWNNFVETCSAKDIVFIDLYFHKIKQILKEYPVMELIKEVQQGNGSNINFLYLLYIP